MSKIKVMLASRPEMISDGLKNIIERQTDMILTGRVVDPDGLIYAIRDTNVDIVVLSPLNSNAVQRICSHIIAKHPKLKIIVLMAEGKAAFLYESGSDKKYLKEPSPEILLDAIRASVEKTHLHHELK